MKILFLCSGNSCRSQMAEGWARHYTDDSVEVLSAGIEAHGKNPRAVIAMQEAGVEIYDQESTVINDTMLDGLDYLITVCKQADSNCPSLDVDTIKEFWPIADPSKVEGSKDEIKAAFIKARDELEQRVIDLLKRVDVYQEPEE